MAGARAGLAGERSGLFRHQIRIIKEMRDADKRLGRTGVAVRPRFAVWENVPGCLSSTSDGVPGSDFREVIEAFLRIEEPYLDVVRPASGRWEYAGAVLGVRSCVAWTEWAAEYFGVPQRRRRIFAVTDFAGFSPIQILFEQDWMSSLFFHQFIGVLTAPNVLLPTSTCGLQKRSMVMLEQIRTLDKHRLLEYIGYIHKKKMCEVDAALGISIGLVSALPRIKSI